MCWHTRPSFFSVHIISQRWQPEQRARSVTIILVGVVRSSMRPDAMDSWVTPQLANAPPTTKPATPQPAMASTSRRVMLFLPFAETPLSEEAPSRTSGFDIICSPLGN